MQFFLRNSAKILRTQDWFAYFVEVIIVVLSVVIAYQLTVWNENNKTKAANRVLLNNLQYENDLNVTSLGQLNTYRKQIETSTRKLYFILDHRNNSAPDSLERYVFELLKIAIPTIQSNILDEHLRNNASDYPALTKELYILKGYYDALTAHGTYHFNLKQKKYYNYLTNTVDFGNQTIVELNSIKSLSFKNNIVLLLNSENQLSILHSQAYKQASKVQQMIKTIK